MQWSNIFFSISQFTSLVFQHTTLWKNFPLSNHKTVTHQRWQLCQTNCSKNKSAISLQSLELQRDIQGSGCTTWFPVTLISTLHLCAKWKLSYIDVNVDGVVARWCRGKDGMRRTTTELRLGCWTNNLIHYFNEVSYRHSALATLVLDEWHFHSTVYGSISVLD